MPEQTSKGIRARQKAARPGEILRAAFAEFVDKGFVAARVEDIAKRVGVTKGTVYFYFETKEHLFEEVMTHITNRLAGEVSSIPHDPAASHVEQLRSYILSVYAMLTRHPEGRDLMRLLIAEAPRFPELVEKHHDRFIGRGVDVVRRIVSSGISAGEFADSALAIYPQLVMSPVVLLTVGQLRFGRRRSLDLEAYAAAHLDLVLNGLRAR